MLWNTEKEEEEVAGIFADVALSAAAGRDKATAFLTKAAGQIAKAPADCKEQALLLAAVLSLPAWKNSLPGARAFVTACYNQYCVDGKSGVVSVPLLHAAPSPFHIPRKGPSAQHASRLTMSNVAKWSTEPAAVTTVNSENRDFVLSKLLRLSWSHIPRTKQSIARLFFSLSNITQLREEEAMSASLQSAVIRTAHTFAAANLASVSESDAKLSSTQLQTLAKSQFEDLIRSASTSTLLMPAIQVILPVTSRWRDSVFMPVTTVWHTLATPPPTPAHLSRTLPCPSRLPENSF